MQEDGISHLGSIIAAHLREWNDTPAFVELAAFGTDDAIAIARTIDAFCTRHLKAEVARGLFHQSSIGSVTGVALSNGHRVVIKVHQPDRPMQFLAEIVRIQSYLAERGVFAAKVIAGPLPLGHGHAIVERHIGIGDTADAHRPEDPREHMAEKTAAATTVERLIDAYIETSVRPRKLRSADKIERTLRREVVPLIGRLSLAELHRKDINRVIDAIMARGKNVAACRCFTIMHGLFAWAVGRGDFEHNPMEKMIRPPDFTPRNRVLTAPEIKTLWNGLTGFPYARILRLCLTTACRVGEASGLARAELDLTAKIWTLPAARSKNKFEHVRPLSSLAIEIIKDALSEARDSAFVFPDASGNAVSSRKVTTAVAGLPDALGLAHFSSHDFRRSVADHLSEHGVDQITIGHILNHRSVTRATVTQRHYVVRNYLPEMTRALELWAERLRMIVGDKQTADVLPRAEGGNAVR